MMAGEKIPFNKPWTSGNEVQNIQEAISQRQIAGDGNFSERCHRFFRDEFGFRSCGLTSSCTDALEMAALLLNIQPGDEVIVPSFAFTSTANAFLLRGATIRFADSQSVHPNIDPESVAALITEKTKAIVPLHYAGMACDMEGLKKLADDRGIHLVEDAAQAIGAYYRTQPLGSIGTFGAFSFHESKNISSGEGGLLTVNDDRFLQRAEIIREKGTNRGAFFRGETDKYNWQDVGSSFLPSNITAAFLYAQLIEWKAITKQRVAAWERYYHNLNALSKTYAVQLPVVPSYATHNGHMFYLVCETTSARGELIRHLQQAGIHAVFHYQSLHSSPYFQNLHDGRTLVNADRYSSCLVRLPLFCGITNKEVDRVSDVVADFFRQH